MQKFFVRCILNGVGGSYINACKWLMQKLAKIVDPKELSRIAMDAGLDKDDLIKSLSPIEEMYDQASFNDKSK